MLVVRRVRLGQSQRDAAAPAASQQPAEIHLVLTSVSSLALQMNGETTWKRCVYLHSELSGGGDGAMVTGVW